MKFKLGEIIKGKVSCGIKNPFYDEIVDLEVVRILKNNKVEVKTVEKRKTNHCLIDVEKNKIEKEWVEENNYVGFLIID